jgi:signal transduction histidine kinase
MGVAMSLDLGADLALDEATRIALYRMVQEALTNIARHARASEVRIGLRQQNNELQLTVLDNGVGFDEALMQREDSYGLMGMRERALMLGGTLDAGNTPYGGGRISVRLPLGAVADAEPARRGRAHKDAS